MRLVDADEVYKVLTDYYHHKTKIQHKALKEAIERVPTVDAVEVVRCKDGMDASVTIINFTKRTKCHQLIFAVVRKGEPMRLIDADALIDEAMDRYCKECDRRKGIKEGKYRIIYEIGEAPCGGCDVDDILCELENAPTVDAESLIAKHEDIGYEKGYRDGYAEALTDNAEPVKHGHWIDGNGNPVSWDDMNIGCPSDSCYCSECGDWLTASDEYPTKGYYCPNCGAKMDEVKDETD